MRVRFATSPVRGFTLIEVLAALVIVSLGMLGVIQAVGQTASNSVYLRDKTLAHWIAMNKLTEVRLSASPPAIDESSDEIDYAGRRWRWTMEVQETPIDSMRRIDVRVSLGGTDNDRAALALLTGFYGEAIAAPGTTFVSWDPLTPGQQGGGEGPGGTTEDSTAGIPTPVDGNPSAVPRAAP